MTGNVGAQVQRLQDRVVRVEAEVWSIETCECCTEVAPMTDAHVVAAGQGRVLIPAERC